MKKEGNSSNTVTAKYVYARGIDKPVKVIKGSEVCEPCEWCCRGILGGGGAAILAGALASIAGAGLVAGVLVAAVTADAAIAHYREFKNCTSSCGGKDSMKSTDCCKEW